MEPWIMGMLVTAGVNILAVGIAWGNLATRVSEIERRLERIERIINHAGER